MKWHVMKKSSKPTSGEKLLEVRNIVVHYAKNQALKGVSLDVPGGLIVALIGANGAGKSTLINLITGLYGLSEGAIHLAGLDITRMPAHRIASLGVARTFQNIRIFKSMSVLENVLVGSHLHVHTGLFHQGLKTSKYRTIERNLGHYAMEALRIMNLESKAFAPAASLTYGEQKLIVFPTWSEDPAPVLGFLRAYLKVDESQSPHRHQARLVQERQELMQDVQERLQKNGRGRYLVWPVFRWMLGQTQRHTRERDTMHFELTRLFPPFRRMLLLTVQVRVLSYPRRHPLSVCLL